jgi:hypothetical protein
MLGLIEAKILIAVAVILLETDSCFYHQAKPLTK